MQRPRFKNEFNMTTLVALVAFASSVFGGGIAWQSQRNISASNTEAISRLEGRMTRVEAETRRLDNHELRIVNVEKQANDAASAMRAVEAALNGLAADMRVTREILQRIEAAQTDRRSSLQPP